MKFNFKSKKFEMNRKEVTTLIVLIYLLITGKLSIIVEVIKSLMK